MGQKFIYYVITSTGKFGIFACDDFDAIRLATWICWRDKIELIKVESPAKNPYSLCICKIDKSFKISSL